MDFIRFDEDEAYAYGFMGFNELSQSYGNMPKQKGDDQILHHEPSLSNGKKHHKDIVFFDILDQAYGSMSMGLGDDGDGPISIGICGWDALEAYGCMDFGYDEV